MPIFHNFSIVIGFCALLLLTLAEPLWATPRDVSHSTGTQLRLDYLNNLLDSRSGQRLAQHNDGATRTEVDALLSEARAALAEANHAKADRISKQALRVIMAAIRALPEDPEEVQRARARYQDLRRGLEKFSYAQEENQARVDAGSDAPNYDRDQVNELLTLADSDAKAGNYDKAVVRLTEAQTIVTSSLQGMLNNRQLVIELDISTPEKEYFYELRRYQGYEELIPVAIQMKKPTEMASETMLKMGEKAKWMSEQARDKAMEGDYPVAIRMMMDATKLVKQALRIVGVTM